jgi:hypothetical protein
MQNQVARLVTVIAAAVILLVVFVSYRARTFHYCVGNNERSQTSHLADGNQPCSPDEQLMDWREKWSQLGWREKFRTLGTTAVEAFGR